MWSPFWLMEDNMKLKKQFFLIIILIGVIIVLGVSIIIKLGNEQKVYRSEAIKTNQKNKETSKRMKIGFSIATYQEERWLMDRDIFIAKCNELDADVIVQAANGDEERQIEQCEKLIDQKVDVLVIISQDSIKLSNIVVKAKEKGIPVVAYDRLIMNCELDAFVTYDNIKIGELQAEYLTEKVPTGNYVLLGGDEADYNSMQIKAGQMKVLEPYITRGDIQIIEDELVKNWNPSDAKKVVSELKQRIDAVLAANDGIAGGVIQALGEKKLVGEIAISGQDADLAGCQRIVEGIQSMTVYTPIKAEAERCAEVAVMIANGEQFHSNSFVDNGMISVPTLLLTPISVDQNNIEATVIKDGYQKFEEVYKHIPLN